jgi:integrase
VIQRRDRVIVALSLLAGPRANATASLRQKHLDVEGRRLIQDAREVRVKNSKSQTTRWFPGLRLAEDIVRTWSEELIGLGLREEDALFPSDKDLESWAVWRNVDRAVIEPAKTNAAVRRAFMRCCKAASLQYFNPHSARHYLMSIRDEHCRTIEQRRAWSYNLGHDKETTSELNYAVMTDKKRDAAFADLGRSNFETSDEKELLLLYHEKKLMMNTPEFEDAERLDHLRRQRHQADKAQTLGTDRIQCDPDSATNGP